MLSRKQREMQTRKNEMILAAELLFAESGYENVTMEDIAKKAEFGRRTLYLYFKTKEDLYLSVFNKYQKLKLEETSNNLNEGATSLHKIYIWGENYFNFYLKNSWFLKYQLIMDSNNISDKNISEDILNNFLEISQETSKIVLEIIKEGISKNEIRSDMCESQVLSYFSYSLRSIAFRSIIYIIENKDNEEEVTYFKKYYFDFLNLLLISIKKESENIKI